MLYKDIMYKIASYFSPNFIVEITEMVTNLDNVTIFDIGFYEGSFSRDIIDSLNAKKINVFSFDPNTQVNTNKFEEFIRDKDIEWKHFDLAVGNLDSEEKFTILKNFPPSGSSVNNILVDSLWLKTRKFILFPFSNKKNDIEIVQVQQRKIDSLDLNISRLDILKIDVEGYSMEVLEGAKNSIKKYKPIVQVEILAKKTDFLESRYKITKFMNNHNYVAVGEKKHYTTHLFSDIVCTDLLFKHK